MTLNARSTISEYEVWLLEGQVQLMDARYNPKHERAHYPWTQDFDSRALEIAHGHWRVESLKAKYNH